MANPLINAGDLAKQIFSYLLLAGAGEPEIERTGNAKKDAKAEAKAKDKQDKEKDQALSSLAKSLLKVLLVAEILGAVLGDASGFRVFMGSIKVLGNVLGSVLTPIFLLGAAVILSLADIISDVLLPNLAAWYEYLFTEGIKWISTLESGVVGAVNILIDAFNLAKSGVISFARVLAAIQTNVAAVQEVTGDTEGAAATRRFSAILKTTANVLEKDGMTKKLDDKAGIGDALGKLGAKDKDGNPIKNLVDRIPGNLQKVIQEFRMQNAPQSQSMSIAEASRNAQMAAFQMSPFEQKNLELLNKISDTLGQGFTKIQPPTVD
jgi:hypothetical protein